jgi:hypothetical protein
VHEHRFVKALIRAQRVTSEEASRRVDVNFIGRRRSALVVDIDHSCHRFPSVGRPIPHHERLILLNLRKSFTAQASSQYLSIVCAK